MRGLREWRSDRGLSIRALVEKSGVAGSTIVRIEHGRAIELHVRTVRALSDALGVSPADVTEFARELGITSAPIPDTE